MNSNGLVKLNQSKSCYDADFLGNQPLVFGNGTIHFFLKSQQHVLLSSGNAKNLFTED